MHGPRYHAISTYENKGRANGPIECPNISRLIFICWPLNKSTEVSPFSFLFHIEAIYFFRSSFFSSICINSLCSFLFPFRFSIIYQSKWTGNTFVCLAKSILITVCSCFLLLRVSALVGQRLSMCSTIALAFAFHSTFCFFCSSSCCNL